MFNRAEGGRIQFFFEILFGFDRIVPDGKIRKQQGQGNKSIDKITLCPADGGVRRDGTQRHLGLGQDFHHHVRPDVLDQGRIIVHN